MAAAGFMTACSVDATEDFNSLDAKGTAKVDNTKPSFDIPTLEQGFNTTENELEVVVKPGATGAEGGFRLRWMTLEDYTSNGWGDDEELGIDMCQEMFQVTGNDNTYSLGASDSFQFLLSDYVSPEGLTCDRPLSCGLEYVFKVQALNQSGKDGLQSSEWSEPFFFATSDCQSCESGYMFGNKEFSVIGKSNNWGWANEFDFNNSTGSQTLEIKHKDDGLGGHVTISWNADDQTISVEESEGVTISHLYISDMEPEDNAPGTFNKTQDNFDEDGHFWVMVKAEVCK